MFQRLDAAAAARGRRRFWPRRDLGSLAGDDRPHMFFNFVGTLDGRAALDGSTQPLGGPADLEMLLSLRAAADAVLIGPGTVRAEGYGAAVSPSRRATPPPGRADLAPLRHPVGGGPVRGRRPAGDRLRAGRRGPAPPDVAAPVEVVRLDECTPAAALADLRRRGVRALLSEGGPTLFRGLLADGPRRRALPHAHARHHRRRGRDSRSSPAAACRSSRASPCAGSSARGMNCSCATRSSG